MENKLAEEIELLKKELNEERKKRIEAEESLKNIENQMINIEHMEYLVSHHPEITFLIGNNGKIMDANELVNKFLGYSPKEIIGENFEEFVVEKAKFEEKLNEAREGNIVKSNLHIYHKEKNLRKVRVKLLPIRLEKKEIRTIFIIVESITEKAFSNDIKEKLLQIVESRKEIICIFALDGEIRYVSPSCKNISGYSPEEVIGKNHIDFIHMKDYDYLKNNCLKKLSKEEHPTFTYRFKKKDGSYIWKESTYQGVFEPETNELKEVISISRDVTDKKKIDNILKENEKRFRVMVEESPDGVFTFKDEKWTYVNKAGLDILGAKRKRQIIGKSIYTFLKNEDKDSFKEKIKEIYKGKRISLNDEKLVRLDKYEIDVEIIGYPVVSKESTVYQLVVRDITEIKKMNELAIISEKLNTVGELAAGMAHEIRNPLTSLKGFIDLIESGQTNSLYFDIMHSELERIEIIVSQLLMSSKPEIRRFSKVVVQKAMNEVLNFLEPEAILHDVIFDRKMENRPIYIETNIPQIKQVFINIIKNGIEAMPDGGIIIVQVEKINEKELSIKISDHGVGIPKDQLEKIGQPFFTTKENGTGLGMMVSFSIIENHNGKINIYSEEGEGTTFEIILPINQEY